MPAKSILVLDSEQKSALAVTRSLGKVGIKVYNGSEEESSLAGSSRYSYKSVRYSSPKVNEKKFIEDLQKIIYENDIEALLPMTDISVFTVLTNEKRFKNLTKMLVGPFEKYMNASNKINITKISIKNDIPVPSTIFIESVEDIKKNEKMIKFPAVLKPQLSFIVKEKKLKQVSVKIVNTYEEFYNTISARDEFKNPFMIQEKIDGEGIGIFALCNKGEIKTIFSHCRLREKPPWGGVSVLCESTPPDVDAKKYAAKLLSVLEWDGVAMVEFKRDKKSGLPMLMEINARFWGSLQLAIDAGVDFPYLLYMQKIENKIAKLIEYRKAKLRWLLGDIDNLIISLKYFKKARQILNNHNRTTVISEFIKEFFGSSRFEILRIDDMKPFFWEFKRYIKAMMN